MNPWPTYSFLKMLSGIDGWRSKEEMMCEFGKILDSPPEAVKEGCVEFSLMFVKEKGVYWN